MKVYFRQMIACALIGPGYVFGKHRECKDCNVDKACLALWRKIQPLLESVKLSDYEEVK